ncbi:MAG: glycosyltransferase family 9 protein [Fimbriimonadaceae bacterium]
MATPVLQAVHSSAVEYEILAAPHLQKLFSREPYADRIDPIGRISGLRNFVQQVREMRAKQFRRVFLINRSARSALVARFAGIQERIGHNTEGRGVLLTHQCVYDTAKFEAECYGDLARLVGLQSDDSRVHLTGSGALKLPNAVGLQPGSTAVHKAIPPVALAVLIEELQARERHVVFLGGKEEAPYAEQVLVLLREPNRIENLIGACSLPETIAKIESMSQVFCGDTGLIHISAGLGVPSVSVFAGTPSSKWGHHYAPHQVIDVGHPDINHISPEKLVEAIL